MNQFTIKDIETLCGIKAHTLRIWEQRYQMFTPKRKESNHRYYDNDDLKQLLRISYLYHKGVKISKIASLNPEDLRDITSPGISPHDIDLYINQLIESSIDFDEQRFEMIFQNVLAYAGFENGIINILYPYLEKIGWLWMTDHVIPAQEHFTSNLINRKIILAIDNLKMQQKKHARRIVLFSPENEHHEIPLLYIFYLLKKQDDKVIYYGKNISVDNLEDYIKLRPVTHVHFHLITNFTHTDVNQYIERLSEKFPHQQIIMSGPKAMEVKIKRSNIRLLLSMQELVDYTRE